MNALERHGIFTRLGEIAAPHSTLAAVVVSSGLGDGCGHARAMSDEAPAAPSTIPVALSAGPASTSACNMAARPRRWTSFYAGTVHRIWLAPYGGQSSAAAARLQLQMGAWVVGVEGDQLHGR